MADPELPVKLSDEELMERALTMSTKLLRVKYLREKKASDAKTTQALIEEELDDIQRIADTIVHCEEGRRQGELFVGQEEAVDALHRIAEAAADQEEDNPPEEQEEEEEEPEEEEQPVGDEP